MGVRMEAYKCGNCGRHWYGELYVLWNEKRQRRNPVCKPCYQAGSKPG